MSNWTDTLSSTLKRDLEDHFGVEAAHDLCSSEHLWPGMSLEQVRAYFQYKAIVKKYNDDPMPNKTACERAQAKFLRINDQCAGWTLNLTDALDDLLIGEFRQAVYQFFFLADQGNIFGSLDALWHRGGAGPGASVDSRGYDFYTKLFDGPLSSTKESLLLSWKAAARKHPLWANAERTRSTRYTDRVVEGNKLSFVNKNVDVARCISTEPMVNMWYQKGAGDAIEDRLRKVFGVDLSNQPDINGELARIGSLDGSYATIDLESASDSIAIKMLEATCPREMVDWLKALRSPYCKVPRKGRVALNMIATMGNGFCFPLQTMLFCCVVRSVYRLLGLPERAGNLEFDPRGKNFGVFGDDIIVRTEAVRWVVRLLNLLGFKVNESKTFVEGPFRESCGQDWYLGHYVRAVYIKRLRTAQDIYVAINTLNRWSACSGIRLQWTMAELGKHISCAAPLVPPDEADTAGIQVPLTMVPVVRRGMYGIIKYRKDSPMPLQILVKGTSIYDVHVSEEKLPASQRVGRRVNLAGLLMTFLGGYLTGWTGGISIRQDAVRYQTKHCITPCWDYFPRRGVQTDIAWTVSCRPNRLLETHVADFADWSSAVTSNIRWIAT